MHGRPWSVVLTLVALLSGAVLIAGCTGTDDGKELNETPGGTVNETMAATITGTGTITYIDLEGGFYGIVAEDGGHYLPIDLDEAFRQDGLEVRFTLEPAKDVATIQQWGMAVRVVSMEKI